MTKENLRKILKSYTVDAIKDGLTYCYNDKNQIKEVLTNKTIDAIVDLIMGKLKKDKMAEFSFGLCKHCKTWAALKDNLCLICSGYELP